MILQMDADSKLVEFDHFRMSAGLTSFVLSPGRWVEATDVIGIFVKGGRYGGTYAHKDIAFEQMEILTSDRNMKRLEERQA